MTFDEIREVLAQVALQQQETAKGLAETRKIVDSNAQGLAETRKIADSNAKGLAETRKIVDSTAQGLAETRKIVDSNARAIEANASAIADLRELIAEERRDTRASIEDLVQMGVETYELVMQNSTDIRGMQVEGRRILRELRDRRRGEG
ncbi:MAG: hypothetical protein DCF22_13345 [Leptolyngbya sp.]|nr:MAG: hypothetical protein DCF22_13345 [Leptolyngbya sp.]